MRYLRTLFKNNLDIEIVKTKNGDEFEDTSALITDRERRSYDNYTYLRDGLQRAVEMAHHDRKLRRLRDSDICIDATAGFKLFSIAAAVVTLDRNILLGYVVSGGADNPEEGVVKVYDPEIQFLGALRHEMAHGADNDG